MSILTEADGLINGPRAAAYGAAIDNFQNIADAWNWHLKMKCERAKRGGSDSITITPEDVGVMMTLLKLARQGNAPKRDNLVDAVGYIGCVEQIELERDRRADATIEQMRQLHTVEPDDVTVYETPTPKKEVAHCRSCGAFTFGTVDKCDTCKKEDDSGSIVDALNELPSRPYNSYQGPCKCNSCLRVRGWGDHVPNEGSGV